ncbi:MAG TPA: FAD-dependent monooxygenase [Xanthobacteraceae bacterium]|nr:FAD-dependent monooxygenase [Xanthobacteraceae bacterium]
MSEKSREKRAIVIGGSMAGLFVAAFLRRIDWRVDIYERSSIELIGRGVGIFATHLELLEALDKCGAGTVDIGVIVYKRVTFDRQGKVIAEKPQLQIVTSWDRLRQVLLKAIDRAHYHFGHTFDRVEQDGSEVQIHFANGRTERADLLIGCDGFRSRVRAELVPQARPVYSGCYIWRGAPNESDLSPGTRRTMFPYYSFFVGDQLQALGYPISGLDDELRTGHRRYNFGWYRVADAGALKQMCVDDQGREYEFGVPPPLVRKDLIVRMRADAEALLPPQYLDCLQHIEQPFFTPVYDFCSPSLVFGRVALVGDAASTPRPHMGFGVSKAGAEAQALAEALSSYDDIDRALAAYNTVRHPLSERIVAHGQKLGMQLGIGILTDDDRRFAQLLQTPNGILDWIAVPNFLAARH